MKNIPYEGYKGIRLPREWTPADNAGTCRVSARTVSGDITVTIVE